ncbi:transmembrane emp24 domain-containing protein p24beta3-like [Triticum dicoccoides]|uniref:transmembrane emp24 domain-containing protein p24beta3-like n=1 Tax=Triticum dicoccoides TaxID=85692 RepID=UPI00188E3815|nr:transmembrane emp24 domain-containing protein p24beta3-like [Triticum dicoccoides]
MARWRLVLLLAVALLAAAGWRADALPVKVAGTECIHELAPYEGDSALGYFVAHRDIDLTVISPGGNTIYSSKGKSSDKIEFKAPSGGMYKFCFHNPYGTPETVSFYIHIGRISNVHNPAKYGRNLVLLEALEEEAMKKRFKEWMDRYHRRYKDEKEKARRYELFKKCAEKVDKLNALPNGVTYGTNHFCDRSEEEMRPYLTGELDGVE